MVKLIHCLLFVLCLTVDIYCITLEQCPPGYRCRPKLAEQRSKRSVGSHLKEEIEIEMCKAGTYSPGGATECTPCASGTYAAHPGAPGCYACPRGHMCLKTNMEPEQCPLGTSNNLTRQTCCRSCPPGKFALFKGMSQCYSCPSGHKCPAQPKLACEEKDLTCVPFWKMPSSDQGTSFTYPNANTRISGDISRSVCSLFRVSNLNDDNIIFSIGSFDTTWNKGKGCNTHFTLAIHNATHINIFGMCLPHDNEGIFIHRKTLYDGMFHQMCITYDNTQSKMCIHLDSQAPQCFIRPNSPYNTALGDVRIGWWPDNNRQFVGKGGGLIRAVSLFDSAISENCVASQLKANL